MDSLLSHNNQQSNLNASAISHSTTKSKIKRLRSTKPKAAGSTLTAAS
jgi:hypothetical protein